MGLSPEMLGWFNIRKFINHHFNKSKKKNIIFSSQVLKTGGTANTVKQHDVAHTDIYLCVYIYVDRET